MQALSKKDAALHPLLRLRSKKATFHPWLRYYFRQNAYPEGNGQIMTAAVAHGKCDNKAAFNKKYPKVMKQLVKVVSNNLSSSHQ